MARTSSPKSKQKIRVSSSTVLKSLGTTKILKTRTARAVLAGTPRPLGLSTRRKFHVATRNLLNDSIRLGVARNKKNESLSSELSNFLKFKRPDAVPVCVRRKERREVLFARKFAGVGKVRRAKWTPESFISCKG